MLPANNRQKHIALNKRITSSKSAGEILSIYERDGRDFNEVNLATAIHRLGKSKHAGDPRLRALIDQATRSITDAWRPRELANVAWAVAKLGLSCSLLPAVSVEARAQIRGFKPQELANTAWAFAKAGVHSSLLFDDIALEARAQMRFFSPQALANTAWAFATLNVESPLLFEAIAAEAPAHLSNFLPQNLANLAWAFATAGISSPALFDAIAEESIRQMRLFKPQDLASTAWAFATLGFQSPLLFEAVSLESIKQIRFFKPQDLASTAWSFAALGVIAPALFERIMSTLPPLRDKLDVKDRSQIYQVLLFLRLEEKQLALAPLPPDFEAELKHDFLDHERKPSRTQLEVAAALNRIGCEHDFEHVTPEGLSLDMAQPASLLAVEFDGPSHYLADVHGGVAGPNGKSLFKCRLLRALGWRVLHLPYFEWARLLDSPSSAQDEVLAAQDAHLSRRLAELDTAGSSLSMACFLSAGDRSISPPRKPPRKRKPRVSWQQHELSQAVASITSRPWQQQVLSPEAPSTTSRPWVQHQLSPEAPPCSLTWVHRALSPDAVSWSRPLVPVT